MNRRIITEKDFLTMTSAEFEMWRICMRVKAYRLLGFDYKKWIRFSEDKMSRSILVEWI